ncbi:Uncharacterised protein [uncultured archaeon]|nr:Uncharacterised protein [uncultured archaeon]
MRPRLSQNNTSILPGSGGFNPLIMPIKNRRLPKINDALKITRQPVIKPAKPAPVFEITPQLMEGLLVQGPAWIKIMEQLSGSKAIKVSAGIKLALEPWMGVLCDLPQVLPVRWADLHPDSDWVKPGENPAAAQQLVVNFICNSARDRFGDDWLELADVPLEVKFSYKAHGAASLVNHKANEIWNDPVASQNPQAGAYAMADTLFFITSILAQQAIDLNAKERKAFDLWVGKALAAIRLWRKIFEIKEAPAKRPSRAKRELAESVA